jgi:predicted phosphohydrolase
MTINCISDIHCRSILDPATFKDKVIYDVDGYKYAFDPKKLKPADYLVIAGDLAHNKDFQICLNDIKEQTQDKFKDVICITGNHDYWNFYEEPVDNYADYVEYVTDDEKYVFLGCTLWTPVREYDKARSGFMMADYKYVKNLTVEETTLKYDQMTKWLRKKLCQYANKNVIIVTHHCPFKEMIDPKYLRPGYSTLNPFFCVMDGSLNDINKYGNIKLWVCGHSHDKYDDVVHNVHVVRNPIGYRSLYDYYYPEVEPSEWYNKIIKV